MSDDGKPLRYIGTPEPYEAFFWVSGEDGKLRLQHCDECERFHHPPQPVCPYCHSTELEPRPVAGTGTIATYTINHQPFMPGFDPPYAIAYVEVDEDPTIRLCTNLVDIDLEDVHIGLRVEVTFEQTDDAWVPLFRPAGGDGAANGLSP
jgi:uncharacterized OB-fold protein